jgi:HK97 gp10 family phage protein
MNGEFTAIIAQISIAELQSIAMYELAASSAHITDVSVNTDRLKALSAKLNTQVQSIMEDVTEQAAERARQAAPKKSGALAESIEVAHVTTSPATDVHDAAVSWHAMQSAGMANMQLEQKMPTKAGEARYITIRVNKPYAGLVEFGSHHGPAQPFFVPAVEWMQAEMVRRIKGLFSGS